MTIKEIIDNILLNESSPELVANKIFKAYKSYNGYSTGINGMCKILHKEYEQHNGFVDSDTNHTILDPIIFKNRFDKRIKRASRGGCQNLFQYL